MDNTEIIMAVGAILAAFGFAFGVVWRFFENWEG